MTRGSAGSGPGPPMAQRHYSRVTGAAHLPHGILPDGEGCEYDDIKTNSLVDQYILTCRTEGKTFSTIRGYREKLRRFLGWGEAAKLGDFTVEMVRDYIEVAPQSWANAICGPKTSGSSGPNLG